MNFDTSKGVTVGTVMIKYDESTLFTIQLGFIVKRGFHSRGVILCEISFNAKTC